MFGDEGLRPPIKYYPMVPPPLVSGARVYGNLDTEVSERGKTFLLTAMNLLQNSLKLFGDAEEVSFDRSIYPGQEIETPGNKFQFFEYIGESEARQVDWGALSRSDMDFDGTTDAGRTIEDVLPFQLYNQNADGGAVDYDAVWDEIKPRLSSSKSFWQDLQDRSLPVSDEGRFAFTIGLLEAKRRWCYGLTGIGINPCNPNSSDAVSRFEEIFNSWKIQEAGALNIQGLQNYVGLRITIAQRYNLIAGNSWLNDPAVIRSVENYYSTRPDGLNAPGVSVDVAPLQRAEGRFSSFRRAENVEGMRSALASFVREMDDINASLRIVPSNLISLRNEINGFRGNISESSPFNRISAALEDAIRGYRAIAENPEVVIGLLFDELTQPLSTESLTAEFNVIVSSSFNAALGKPIGFVAGIQGMNGTFMAMNRTNRARYEQQKEDKMREKQNEARAEGKRMSAHKNGRKEGAKNTEAGSATMRRQEAGQMERKAADRKRKVR